MKFGIVQFMKLILQFVFLCFLFSGTAFGQSDKSLGIRAFECFNDDEIDGVPLVFLKFHNEWVLGTLGNQIPKSEMSEVVVTQTSPNAFTISNPAQLFQFFITPKEADGFEYTAFNGETVRQGLCVERTSFAESISNAILPKISENYKQLVRNSVSDQVIKRQLLHKIDGLENYVNQLKQNIVSLKSKYENPILRTFSMDFPESITTNLKDSRRYLQVSLGLSTKVNQTVLENVNEHVSVLKSAILLTLSDYTEEDIKGTEARRALSYDLQSAINAELESLGFIGGIERVHFTSFVLQ